MTRLLALCLATLAACSTPQGPPLHELAEQINGTLYQGLDRLSPGDEFDVKFRFAIEYDQSLVVQGDGQCSFLGLGFEQVAGLLPSELQEQLQERYSAMLEGQDASLSVIVTSQAVDRVYVMGEVRSPGARDLPVDRELTFLQALALGGGPDKATSWMSNVLLVRMNPETQRQDSWIIDARQQHWGQAETIILQEYDVIYVPNTRIDQIGIALNQWVWGLLPFPRNSMSFATGQ